MSPEQVRSGEIWVQGSSQFNDFEEDLLAAPRFTAQREQKECGLAVETDCERFLQSRLSLLERRLATVERLAAANELPDAAVTSSGRLKITRLDNTVPDEAEALMRFCRKFFDGASKSSGLELAYAAKA